MCLRRYVRTHAHTAMRRVDWRRRFTPRLGSDPSQSPMLKRTFDTSRPIGWLFWPSRVGRQRQQADVLWYAQLG